MVFTLYLYIMHTKIFFTFLLVVTGFFVRAADISFVVYFVKGTVHKNSTVKIKKGDKILAGESIAVGNNSAVILVCSNYKVIQLNKKAVHTAKSLLSQCTKDAAGYSSSYFKYVWNEFTHPHGKPESSPEEYMKNIGAASRGCNSVQTGIRVDTIHFFTGTLPVYWKSNFTPSILGIYEVPVDGGPLQKTILEKDQPVKFEQVTRSLQPGEYYWQIMDTEGNSCERNYLKVWDKVSYQDHVAALLAGVPVTSAAETAFARAFILHENHFLAEAIQYYTLACKLAPGNKIYKKTLSEFYATQF